MSERISMSIIFAFMIKRITIEGIDADEFYNTIRQIVKEELQLQNDEIAKERLLSPEVARRLFQPAVSKQTLHRWTKDGLLNVHRLGGRIFYKESEVIEASKTLKKYKHSL